MNENRKMTKKEASMLGTIKMREAYERIMAERIAKYNANPKRCKNCDQPLSYEQAKGNSAFCSRSCSAVYHNLRRSQSTFDKIHASHKIRQMKLSGDLGDNPDMAALTAEYMEGLELFKDRVCPTCGEPVGRTCDTYCSRQCMEAARWDAKKEEIEFFEEYPHESSGETDRRVARRYLEERCGHRCSICGAEMWNEQPIPLVVDHVDGNAKNHSVHNLRLVCPNCDAQLPTFKNRNRQANRPFRRKENKQS